jgi:uncharacterized membrane protein
MAIFVLTLLIGVVAGLRAMTAPAAVSWAAYLGWLPVADSWAAFMGYTVVPIVFTLLAIVELVADQLPSTPSRKVPVQFATRIVSGAFCGAVLGAPSGDSILGLVAGAVGAVIGTLGGAELRARLVAATGGRDAPIALLEDAVAIGGALLIVAVA